MPIITRAARTLTALLLAPLLMLGLGACCEGNDSGGAVPPSPTMSSTPSPSRTGGAQTGELPEIDVAQLPPEARQTLKLIDAGGPFPYPRKDGTYFLNREGVLPQQPRGYYREYTVPTPGEKTRGARRVVTGQSGERYYTGDHYRSFSRIVGE